MVDLLTHRPIDLFPGRTEEQVKHWLLHHPSIQTVSRDGSRAYQTAITETSPHIIQVTDRWHILKGLFESAKEEVYHYFPAKRKDPPIIPKSPTSSSKRKSDRKREEREEKHWQRIQQVQLRHEQGESVAGLARAFHLARGTIYHYLTVQTPPSHKRGSPYDSYRSLIHALIQQGKKGDEIEVVCRQSGYQGARSTLNTMIAQERQQLLPPASVIKPSEVFKTLWSMSHPKQPTGEIKEEWEA
ncbi:transposase [Alkalicoccus daliensis]|uniref:Helix-turn-helix domain of resolvase n=1 Tax=Alkalicoccus daliensis TaxID=745820 RepID=A0A1H0GFK7_9BACI|nr:transposase [Alkalicoccus daliensis]SDO05715.1 Helix-turn-helix domain of resolvase [Alkalicoccus daliensis]